MIATVTRWTAAACLAAGLLAADRAAGNAGRFRLFYPPHGDPAARGVLARLDPTLQPARETLLRVVKEDLSIGFQFHDISTPAPITDVEATYTIENPTDKKLDVDFGFPILRGIVAGKDGALRVNVRVPNSGVSEVKFDIITNSVIYGLIRQPRAAIDKGIAADKVLAGLVAAVRKAVKRPEPEYDLARKALRSYLVDRQKWNPRDAALMVAFASLDLAASENIPFDRWSKSISDPDSGMTGQLTNSDLGPLAAIGEQKATQFFGQLASRFDKDAAADYEAIFTASGGNVRQRAVDLRTGAVRPRELKAKPANAAAHARKSTAAEVDDTVYARVDYLDPKFTLGAVQKAACREVLKNLPVTFTFAPMNLLHYRVAFPPKSKRLVTVAYEQYAYVDTAGKGSYQLAYVLHPATLWNSGRSI